MLESLKKWAWTMTKGAFFFGCLIWFLVHLSRMSVASYYAQIGGIPSLYKISFYIAIGLLIFGYFWNVISPQMSLRARLMDVFFWAQVLSILLGLYGSNLVMRRLWKTYDKEITAYIKAHPYDPSLD